jgi:hypothetical protein
VLRDHLLEDEIDLRRMLAPPELFSGSARARKWPTHARSSADPLVQARFEPKAPSRPNTREGCEFFSCSSGEIRHRRICAPMIRIKMIRIKISAHGHGFVGRTAKA